MTSSRDARRVVGVIDVGTNSVKLYVAQRLASGRWRTLADRGEVTRLGEGLERGGELSPEAMDRTAEAIADMAGEARDAHARGLVAVGTMGLRSAANADRFLDTVRARCGLSIEVLSGEEEGRLAYLGAVAGLDRADGHLVVFDTGGGSTEFTVAQGDYVVRRFSLNVGAVRLTEWFGLDGVVSKSRLRETLATIGEELDSVASAARPDLLVGMGGAITSMSAVLHRLERYDPEVVQGSVLGLEEVDRQLELYRTRDAAARRDIVGLQPRRAEVILAGACVARTVMDKLEMSALTVSDRGLRHGLLVDRFDR